MNWEALEIGDEFEFAGTNCVLTGKQYDDQGTIISVSFSMIEGMQQ